jgi:geranylgeranyl diphosphate synthase type II
MSSAQVIQEFQCRAEEALDRWLPPETVQPKRLHKAMRYAVLGDGKRVRPILVYATGYVLRVNKHTLDGPACAVELVHAYSLIHDDLPSMDNDDLRRGRPTCHRAFDEATAILAGDALQALAFRVLAHDPKITTGPKQRLEMIDTLAQACGSRGMAGGQAIDLEAVGRELTLAELENMHIHKTGALIRASVKLGALSKPEIEAGLLARLDRYAKCIGLAFQVQDDILDVEAPTDTLGKPQGSDLARNKPTYPNLLGLEGARQVAGDLHREAIESLASLGQAAEPLRWIADYIIERDR